MIGMNPFTAMWAYWFAMGGGVPAVWTDQGLPAAGRLALSDLDAVLIQLAYKVIAAESVCDRCGTRLGSVSRIMAVGYRPEPVQGFDEVECGLVMAGQLVVTGGQPAPVLAAVEAAFHLVASAVGGAVEVRWPAAGAAAPLPVGDLVVGFRDDSDDVPRTQQLAVGPRRVRLSPVSESGCSRGLPIPPGRATATWSSSIPSCRVSAGLARRDAGCQGPATSIAEGVDLGGQTAAGTPDPLPCLRLLTVEPPLRAPAAC
jgi:hypothetical protein